MATIRADEVQRSPGNLLRWLGLGRDAPEEERESANPISAGERARRELLSQICSFLLDNKLAITPRNLCIAHAAFAGLNPGLERRIERRKKRGVAVDQPWLDEVTALDGDSDDQSVDKLVGQLEKGIEDFSRSTSSARNATSEYSDALKEQMGQLEAAGDPDEVIAKLTEYATAMLERSRKAEEELRNSESEAEALRHNLDNAKREAEFDFLTGLPNRRAFEAMLEKEYREAQAAVEPLSVAFCDIDHFKGINDTHGHEAGDRVICSVADTLNRLSDEKCHVARHGGEEFVLLLRGLTAEKAFEKLDRCRERLAARRMINRRTKEPFGQVTFSAGIADVLGYSNPREALAAADEALYAAKDGGRNQIRLAGAATPIEDE